jgi:superfamily II DNA or RNA helicase
MPELRDYQREAVDAIYDYFTPKKRNPLVVMPTGSGKSHVIAAFMHESLEQFDGTRICSLTHVKELIEQNHNKLREHWSFAPAGIYSAGLRSRATRDPIIFGGIQSVYKRAKKLGRFDIVMIDECFPSGTLVDGRPIETIRSGDWVQSFNHRSRTVERRRVVATRSCWTQARLVTLTLANGTKITCTENHPLFTGESYEAASSIRPGKKLFVSRLQWRRDQSDEQPAKTASAIGGKDLLLTRMLVPAPGQTVEHSDDRVESDGEQGNPRKDVSNAQEDRTQAAFAGRKRTRSNQAATLADLDAREGLDRRARDQDRNTEGLRCDLVFGRLGTREQPNSRRSRRPISQRSEKGSGSKARRDLVATRVVHVEVHEQGSADGSGWSLVHNLQVDRNENYFAEGCLAHNCHLVPKGAEGMYRRFLDDMLDMNDKLVVIGLTATPYRMKGGLLHRGKGRLFDGIAYDTDLLMLIREGYLSPLIPKQMKAEIDTTGVHVRGGEFVREELEERVDDHAVIEASVDEILQYGGDRRSWLVFCCGVKHAANVTDEIRKRGIGAHMVTADTPADERRQMIEAYKSGRLRSLVNVNVLTTGFDAPETDLLAVLRPTKSPGLYVQIMGRGMRMSPDKNDCILRGTLVLTDHGEVPIEMITVDMLVWDGVEFVEHRGAVCRGVHRVVSYAGIVGTPDHKVLTRNGWKSLQECIDGREDVCVGSENGRPLRQAAACFRSREERDPASPCRHGVHGLRGGVREGSAEFRVRHGRLPSLCPPKISAFMARDQMYLGEAAMHESTKRAIRGLWWPRDQVFVFRSDGDGAVVDAKSRLPKVATGGPYQQRRPLRARQHSHGERDDQPVQHEGVQGYRGDARLQNGASGSPVRGLDFAELAQDSFLAGCRSPISQTKQQTEGEVWDLLNAGPRHRFTAAGLIVSNCLVLDFAGNVARHGPINLVKPQSDGSSGVAPTKTCPECNTIVFAATRECPDCGYVWPPPEDIKPRHDVKASTDDPIAYDGGSKVHEVSEVWYGRHSKANKPDSLRVEYRCGMTSFSEWVCLEHDGYPGELARSWWRKRGLMPCPMSVEKALDRVSELRKVVSVRVERDGRYNRVVGVKFEQRQEVLP